MNKFYFFLILLILCSCDLIAGTNEIEFCIKSYSVNTTKMHPPVRLKEFVESKKESLLLYVPVKCKNKKPIIPNSRSEAIHFLDIMLPIDFKAGMLKTASLRSVYLHSPYGASIVYDLYGYIEEIWELDNRQCKICEKNSKVISCYFQLLEELTSQYQ